MLYHMYRSRVGRWSFEPDLNPARRTNVGWRNYCEMCLNVKMYMFSKCVVISVIKLLNVMFMLNVVNVDERIVFDFDCKNGKICTKVKCTYGAGGRLIYWTQRRTRLPRTKYDCNNLFDKFPNRIPIKSVLRFLIHVKLEFDSHYFMVRLRR